MMHIEVGGAQPFAVGAGAPDTQRRATAPRVSLTPIRATTAGEEPDGFDVVFSNEAGVAAFLWPPPLGAPIAVFDDGQPVVSGTIIAVDVRADITISAQL
jgi:hypothetical protein